MHKPQNIHPYYWVWNAEKLLCQKEPTQWSTKRWRLEILFWKPHWRQTRTWTVIKNNFCYGIGDSEIIQAWEVTDQGPSGVGNYHHTKFASCEFSKSQRHVTQLHKLTKKPEKEMELKKRALVSDERMSVDQYSSVIPGRLYNYIESTNEESIYHGGSIYVDHGIGRVSVLH